MSDYSRPRDEGVEARKLAVNDVIRDVELSKLTVGDLFTILEVYKTGYLPPYEWHVSQIEEIVRRVGR